MHILSHCGNTITAPYIIRTQSYRIRLTRAYCKLQKLLPLTKLISKYASWHLMPSVTEVRAKDPAGGLKFVVPFSLLPGLLVTRAGFGGAQRGL